MEITTLCDIGDKLIIRVEPGREELASIKRIDIMSMDRGCYSVEYTTNLLKCEVQEDGSIKETPIIIPEHEINNPNIERYALLYN